MCGCTWGTSVATGTPATSAASDAAGVMMSATAMSGRILATISPVSRAALTAAA